MICGLKREDGFQAKKYSKTVSHQLYQITNIKGDSMEMTNKRYGETDE